MPSPAEAARGSRGGVRGLRRRGGGVLVLALVLVAGCGGGDAGAPAPPQPGMSGHFVGRAGDGLGAAVDFGGIDAVATAVRRALGARGGAVAVASVVNDGPRAAPLPRFAALTDDGRRVPLLPARAALAGRRDGGARRARAALAGSRPAIPGEGSALLYLVLRAASPRELRSVVMLPATGAPVELRERPG